MNTFERHRHFVLRRQRSRRLRLRALAVTGACIAVLGMWGLAARLSPPAVAPPGPVDIGTGIARGAARTASSSINHVYGNLRPGFRDDAKRQVRRLLDVPSDIAPLQARDPSSPPSVGTGRTVDILLIGVDSRLGHSRGRADALHLLSIDVSDPGVRITSIPRGTPSWLGYEDDASNIIANVLPARGRAELQRRVARMCGRDSVPYFVQLGFSDAIGVLNLLGFEHADDALQALRQRQGYQYGDHNRCYNQGLFIRAMMQRMLPLLDGATGALLLQAGLDLLETNLPPDVCRGIVYLLNDADIARHPDRISVSLRSRFRDRIASASPIAETLSGTGQDAAGFLPGDAGAGHARARSGLSEDRHSRAEARMRAALAEGERLRAQPRKVQALLATMFAQHAWMQLPAGETRRALRDSLAAALLEAAGLLDDETSAASIRRTLRADDLLFPPRRADVPPSTVSIR